MNAIAKIGTQAISTVKKYSPQILLGTGIVTGGAGIVLACKQTLKINDILEDDVNTLQKIDDTLAEGNECYTAEDAKRDKKEVYLSIVKKCVKTYALPAALEIASLASFSGCYAVLNHDNKELRATLVSYASAWATYRERVREKYGDEVDRELMLGKPTVVTDENGTVIKEEYDKSLIPQQMIYFDRHCCNWVNNADYNKNFLELVQSMLQDKLDTQGYLTSNDVREAVGAPYIREPNEAVNWVINGWRKGSTVDLGLTRDDPEVQAFMRGECKNVWLKLNIDGPINKK